MRRSSIYSLFSASFFYFFVLILITISCQKEQIKPVYSLPIFTRSGDLKCYDQMTPEYDILALGDIGEWDNAITAAKALKDTTFYNKITSQIDEAIGSGFSVWLDDYEGVNLTSGVKSELLNLVSFLSYRGVDANFNIEVDSLIDEYLVDTRFNLREKNMFITCAEVVKVL